MTPAPSPAEDAPPSHANAPVEIVERPDAGTLARGVWEAPAWAFYAMAGVVLLAALLYGSRLAGFFGRRPPRG